MIAEPPVATVWIDNPPLNLLTASLTRRLADELERAAAAARVVVLRGRGERGFSAGADIAELRAGSGPPAGIQPLAERIESLAVPVVAAIHGHCYGGGLEVALACDVRVAHAEATLALPEVGLGLVPGGGGTQRAPRLIGAGRAAWLILSSERLPAARAEAWGLVEFVVDDLDSGVDAVTARLVGQSPAALAAAKRLLQATRDRRSDELELATFDECLRSVDAAEGLAALRERRAPDWPAR